MDKRIGYGLSLEEAVKKAIEEVGDKFNYFSFRTRNYDTIWGELRGDGWRVYSDVEKPQEEKKVVTELAWKVEECPRKSVSDLDEWCMENCKYKADCWFNRIILQYYDKNKDFTTKSKEKLEAIKEHIPRFPMDATLPYDKLYHQAMSWWIKLREILEGEE